MMTILLDKEAKWRTLSQWVPQRHSSRNPGTVCQPRKPYQVNDRRFTITTQRHPTIALISSSNHSTTIIISSWGVAMIHLCKRRPLQQIMDEYWRTVSKKRLFHMILWNLLYVHLVLQRMEMLTTWMELFKVITAQPQMGDIQEDTMVDSTPFRRRKTIQKIFTYSIKMSP